MRDAIVKAGHVLLVGLSVLVFSCDEGLRAEQTGTVQLSAPSFVIPKKVPGETAEQSIDVRNVGTGILRIINIDGQFGSEYDLYWTRADEEQQRRGIEDGQSYFPDAIDIAPEEQITLHLVYLARMHVPRGRIVLEQTIGNRVAIPIVGAESGAESVMPTVIDFGRGGGHRCRGDSCSDQLWANRTRIREYGDQWLARLHHIHRWTQSQRHRSFCLTQTKTRTSLSPNRSVDITIHYRTTSPVR